MKEQEIQHLKGVFEDGSYSFSSPGAIKGFYERLSYFRKYSSLLPLLEACKGASWLTVGDSYGNDGIFIKSHGGDATCSDLYLGVLEEARSRGLLDKCQEADLERLPFSDGAFDFVVCSMCLHHLSKPYLGIYEMSRVAAKAFVVIEPNDVSFHWAHPLKRLLKKALLMESPEHSYEHVGNYLYAFSRRELEKAGVPLGVRCVATRWFNTSWNESISNPLVKSATCARILLKDALCLLGLDAPVNIASVLFKQEPDARICAALKAFGYSIAKLPSNGRPPGEAGESQNSKE